MNPTTPEPTTTPDETFQPIDAKTFKWEPGARVRNQVECLIVLDKDKKHIAVFPNFNWISSNFTMTVVRPTKFEELCALVDNAVKEFLEHEAEFLKNETEETVKAVTKALYGRLFAYWYEELNSIKLTDAESFAKAKEKFKTNGNGHGS